MLCPACGHQFAQDAPTHLRGRRVCRLCGLVIGKHHKWTFGSDGRPEHRDCKHPTAGMGTDKEDNLFERRTDF